MWTLVITALICFSKSWANDVAAEFEKSNNLLFTPSLYKEVAKIAKGNFLISPLSAEVALSFAQSGCKGETAQEIRNVLRLPDDKNKVELALKNLLPSLINDNDYVLRTVNKMYIKNEFQINDGFKKTATEIYHSDTENIDFTNHAKAAETMNKWVEDQTENRIHNLVNPDYIDAYTRIVLINALYLKANWSSRFSGTRKKTFYKTETDVVEVDTMHKLFRSLPYYECHNLNAKFVELEFKGGDGSLTIILPNEKEGLGALEDKIDRVFVPHNLSDHVVSVNLPRLKIETQTDMKNILQNMGMGKAFNPKEADLSNIAGDKGDLVVDRVEQKTVIDVNEEGVEAAAATYVVVPVPTSGFSEQPKQFSADHPFIFYIKVKGVIIFAGRVTDPSQ